MWQLYTQHGPFNRNFWNCRLILACNYQNKWPIATVDPLIIIRCSKCMKLYIQLVLFCLTENLLELLCCSDPDGQKYSTSGWYSPPRLWSQRGLYMSALITFCISCQSPILPISASSAPFSIYCTAAGAAAPTHLSTSTFHHFVWRKEGGIGKHNSFKCACTVCES